MRNSRRLIRSIRGALERCVQPLAALKELRVAAHTRFRCTSWVPPASASFIAAIVSPSVRVLEIVFCHSFENFPALYDFVRAHGELVEFSINTVGLYSKKPPEMDSTIVRLLAENCPHLRRLCLIGWDYLGDSFHDDVRLLHNLESLTLRDCKPKLVDDDVIGICEHNPSLREFDLDSKLVTTRAFTDGVALLHCLETLCLRKPLRIDSRAFEAIIRANSASIREVLVDDRSLLNVVALCSLGSQCSFLETRIWLRRG